jgi:hypothetical protein
MKFRHLTTNQGSVTSQKSEDLNYATAEVWNHRAAIELKINPEDIAVRVNKISGKQSDIKS